MTQLQSWLLGACAGLLGQYLLRRSIMMDAVKLARKNSFTAARRKDMYFLASVILLVNSFVRTDIGLFFPAFTAMWFLSTTYLRAVSLRRSMIEDDLNVYEWCETSLYRHLIQMR